MEWKQNTLDLLYKPKFLNEIPNYGSQCSVILLALTPPQGPFPATYISNYVCLSENPFQLQYFRYVEKLFYSWNRPDI